MARSSSATQTASGARSVTRLEVPGDMDELLEQRFAQAVRQKGEITTSETAKRYHVTIDQARAMLDSLVAEGLATRRKPGLYVYYRLAK